MQREHAHVVDLLASAKYGTPYIGVTNDIIRRMIEREHQNGEDLFPALFRDAFPQSTPAASVDLGPRHKASDDSGV